MNTMNTDTPDIEQLASTMYPDGSKWVQLEDCRKIQRERNQARQERDEALWAMLCCAESKIEPIESLYQAREILKKLKEPKSEGVS